MKVESCKRIVSCLVVLALTLISALPVQAASDIWKVEPISARGVGGDIVRNIYVPKGAQWTGASLHLDVEPAADSYLGVWVDGTRIMRREFDQNGSVDLDIGNLASGFHKIIFRVAQQKLLAGNGNDVDSQRDDCRADTGGTFVLKNVALRYFQSANHPALNDLPEALFNPQLPGASAWQGLMVADPSDTLSASVAARIASGWQATAGIQWAVSKTLESGAENSKSTDFVVQLVHNPQMTVPARLELVPAHVSENPQPASSVAAPVGQPALEAPIAQASVPALLRISFRDEAGAFSAANALLNPEYLAQLDAPNLDLDHAVAAPSWGGEKPYETLADFGVGDVRLGVQPDASLFLPVPAAWEPTGMVSGVLTYRVQKGLLQGSALRVWINNALTGSSVLHSREIKPSDGTLNFHSDEMASGQRLLPMYLDSHMLVTQQCTPGYNGELWIDASKSQVEIPHRYKSGVGALQTALIAKPDIRIDGQPASLAAALALASSMHDLVGNHPLPFRIVNAQDTNTPAPVSIAVDAASYRQQAGQHPDKMASSLLKQGTLVELVGSDYKVVASDVGSLHDFAEHWGTSRFDIQDGSDQIFMTSDGSVVTPQRTQVAAALAVSTGDHYQLLIYLGIALLLLIMLGAWLLSRRR